MKQIGFLNCNLYACSKTLKELSYKQFVLPILDYTSSVWDPYHHGDVNKLEMVWHRAARFVLNQPWRRNIRDSITLLLEQLNWLPLKSRSECTRLVLLYKLINQILQIPAKYLQTRSQITATKSKHSKQGYNRMKERFKTS